jgi:L-arabinose isomerase
MKPMEQLEVWFVTGSQDLYGETALRQVADNAKHVAEALDASPTIPVHVVYRPIVTSAEGIRQVCLEANASDASRPQRITVRAQSPSIDLTLTFSVEDLVANRMQAGPLASATPRVSMNLNQAAHGDREFGFIGSHGRLPEDRRRPLA